MNLTAESLLELHWDQSLIVNPTDIAEKAGVRVIECEGYAKAGYVSSYRLLTSQPIIHYNPDEPEQRLRFAIAHSLGHWALGHPPEQYERIPNFQYKPILLLEKAANEFAVKLLVHEDVLRWIVKRGNTDIKEIAKSLNVSSGVVRYRMELLGLVK